MMKRNTPQFLSARVKPQGGKKGGITLFNTSGISYLREDGSASIIGIKYDDGTIEEVQTEETIFYLRNQMFGLNTFLDRLLFLLHGGGK